MSNNSTDILVIGAGGHSKVVIEILEMQGLTIVGVIDDNPMILNDTILGYPIIGNNNIVSSHPCQKVIIAIGDNILRKKWYDTHTQSGKELWTAIHPSAQVSKRASVSAGCVIMANVSVNADTKIKENCIINTSATIDHDCLIHAHTHIGPNVALCGNIEIGESSLLGVGCSVIPGKKIGKNVIIGAGACVVKDVEAGKIVTGVPAK